MLSGWQAFQAYYFCCGVSLNLTEFLYRSSHIFVFWFWYFGHFSCVIFFLVFFRLDHLVNKDYVIISYFLTSPPKVTKNQNVKWNEWNIWHGFGPIVTYSLFFSFALKSCFCKMVTFSYRQEELYIISNEIIFWHSDSYLSDLLHLHRQ